MTDETDEKMGQNDTSEKKKHFDYDGLWKDILDKFFYPLLKRALPELYEKADKTKRPTFLNKESFLFEQYSECEPYYIG
jgi:hypothetical protein